MRPTRHRLIIALGMSACAVAVLLEMLGSIADMGAKRSSVATRAESRLTVHVRSRVAEPAAGLASKDQVTRALPQRDVEPIPDLPKRIVPDASREPPVETPPRQWSAAAGFGIDEYFRQESSRAAMWKQSRSVMFQPPGEFEAEKEVPVLANFRFEPQIRVLGLGLTIGSCFIGIPIAGVPVEQRTVGPNLIVCARDAG